MIISIVLFFVSAAFSTGDLSLNASTCPGACIDTTTTSCWGTLHPDLCPGGANIVCCEGGCGCPCSGQCINVNYQGCTGTLEAGECPGPAEIQCCAGGGPPEPDGTCGGDCPSGDCPSCPCGTAVNQQDVATWCAKWGGWDQGCCQCIMSHESGGNANAANYNTDATFDVGLWQINQINWNNCAGGNAPCDPNANLQCAIDIYQGGGNSFQEWSTCTECGCC